MRRTKSEDADQGKETKELPATIDEYIAGVEEPARSVLVKVRGLIRGALPAEAAAAAEAAESGAVTDTRTAASEGAPAPTTSDE